MAGRLAGKVALITGASSGIGQAAAWLFAREGAAGIGINYARSESGARKTLEGVEATGRRGLLLQGDVANDASDRRMVEAAVRAFGRLDILVNNAGTTFFVDMADLDGMTEDKWDRIYDVNVKGLFWCSRAAAPALKAAKGQIINVSSKAGLTGAGSSIAYAASKAAVIALTKGLASALAPEVARQHRRPRHGGLSLEHRPLSSASPARPVQPPQEGGHLGGHRLRHPRPRRRLLHGHRFGRGGQRRRGRAVGSRDGAPRGNQASLLQHALAQLEYRIAALLPGAIDPTRATALRRRLKKHRTAFDIGPASLVHGTSN